MFKTSDIQESQSVADQLIHVHDVSEYVLCFYGKMDLHGIKCYMFFCFNSKRTKMCHLMLHGLFSSAALEPIHTGATTT